ncbi:MAG: hypothetical protein KGH72_04275 [Candidatus Micrarchaeota archaeon]|nr:hypothetical protein [Candidatus Micrarchaeota archaeon]
MAIPVSSLYAAQQPGSGQLSAFAPVLSSPCPSPAISITTTGNVVPSLLWNPNMPFPMVNGRPIPPPARPLTSTLVAGSCANKSAQSSAQSAPPPSQQAHWYGGAITAENNTQAASITTTLQIPPYPLSTPNFYYVLMSAWDSAGSYDQIGFADNNGQWGLAYSWTTGPPSNLSYHFSPEAMPLISGDMYTFNIIAQSGYTQFLAYQGSNEVWSIIEPTGARYMNLSTYNYGGFLGYTDYQEIWNISQPSGVDAPPYDFNFTANRWTTASGITIPSFWNKFNYSTTGVIPNGFNVQLINDSVNVNNPAGGLVTTQTTTITPMQPSRTVYVPSFCSAMAFPPLGSNSVSCSVPAAKYPGAFCLGASANASQINLTYVPQQTVSTNGLFNFANIGWYGNKTTATCAVNVLSTNGLPIGVGGLAVNSFGPMYFTGESGASVALYNGIYTYKYSTDKGTQPEAVAILVSCSRGICQNLTFSNGTQSHGWPNSCQVVFNHAYIGSKNSQQESQLLALCNQTEGNSYVISLNLTGAETIEDIRFADGVWGSAFSPSPLAIDGSSTSQFSSARSGTVTLSTSNTNDMIIIDAGFESTSTQGAQIVNSISDTAGLNWTMRNEIRLHPDSHNAYDDMEEWYAVSPSKLSSDVITVHLSGTIDDAVLNAFGISGANVTSPFDKNITLPGSTTGANGGVATAYFATSNPNDIIFGMAGNDGGAGSGGTYWVGTNGYNTIVTGENNGAVYWWGSGAAYKITNVTLAFNSITMAETGGYSSNWIMLDDAIKKGPTLSSTAMYSFSACNGISTQGNSTSCSVTASASPGVFCWGAASNGPLSAPAWPISQAASGGPFQDVAETGSPWTSGSTCTSAVSSNGYAPVAVGGLSVNALGNYKGITGVSIGSYTGNYTFAYHTDPGSQPEAVALMISCGFRQCMDINLPAGCQVDFFTAPSSNAGQVMLALCNQTEGNTYLVNLYLTGGGAAIQAARFDKGLWSMPIISPPKVVYSANTCNAVSTSANSVSCSVQALSYPGAFCAGSAANGTLAIGPTTQAVASSQSVSNIADVYTSGMSGYQTCNETVAFKGGAPIGVAGLAVSSNTLMNYTGETSMSLSAFNGTRTYTYFTDPGPITRPEAVAILVSCGGGTCPNVSKFSWPTGCKVQFGTTPNNALKENQIVALCNQTESGQYRVVLNLSVNGAENIEVLKFANGVWGAPQGINTTVVYTPNTCNSIAHGNSTSCTVTASTSPGVFCWSSTSYGPLIKPSWSVSQSASGPLGQGGIPSNVAQSGAPWTSGSTCTTASSNSTSNNFENVQSAGLSVSSSGNMQYSGEGGISLNRVGSFNFSYGTDPGNQPEAVAIMVSCGYNSCGTTINWPAGCKQSIYSTNILNAVALELCNQTEGNSYTVSDPSLGGTNTGVTISYAKFKNGRWGGQAGASYSPALAMDGSNSTVFRNNVSSAQVSFTTSNTNDVIVLDAGFETTPPQIARAVSSVTDSDGLTWFKRSSLAFHPDVQNASDDEEIWYAIAPAGLSSDVIKVAFTGNVDAGVLDVFGISGANLTSPWDQSTALPATANGINGAATVQVSTINRNDMLLGFAGNDGGPTLAGTSPSDRLWIGSGNYATIATNATRQNSWWSGGAAYQIVNSLQSSTPVTLKTNKSSYSVDWLMIGDAIKQATSPSSNSITIYNANTCNGINRGTGAISCTVSASASPGVFCWGADGNGPLNTPSWPVFQNATGSGSLNNVSEMGSPWASGSTCTASSSHSNIQIGALSVSANGTMRYSGEGGASLSNVGSFSFTYNTDAGMQPEAVALMVACGWTSCGSKINWPSGCNQTFMYPVGAGSSVALALCNQTEGSSYTLNDSSLGGTQTGVTFAYAKFQNGRWGTVTTTAPFTTTTTSTTTTSTMSTSSTTTIPPANSVTATFCDTGPSSSNSASCSVPSSTAPGVFCWAAQGNGALASSSWPVFLTSSGGSYLNVSKISSPWSSGATCTAAVHTGAPAVEAAGLSVSNSSGVFYGGQSGTVFNNASSASFTYNTDAGTQPEAVALLVSCGWFSCGSSVTWPAGCSQQFLTPIGYAEALGLALCNQTEGSSYTVNVPSAGGPSAGIAISDVRFKNGKWT